MRKVTTALLIGAYIFLAMTVAALLWRGGAGLGASAAALIGSLGLVISAHVWIAMTAGDKSIREEIEGIREAHRLMLDALDLTRAEVKALSEIEDDSVRQTEALTTEVRMLEHLVERMSADLQARPVSYHAPGAPPSRLDRQASALLDTVREALAENRVDLYLQPVVTLPQRKIMFYESFSRLRDETGRILMPAEYLAVAEPEGLAPAIDNLLLFRCVQIVRRLAKQDRRVGIFCNVSLASLGDEEFFPQFLDFLSENRDLGGALIFELGREAFDSRGAVEARNMAKLADLGFRFSLDKVGSLDFDFQDLQRSDVKFVKVPADLLLEQLLDLDSGLALAANRDIHAGDFAALTRRYGVEIVAEKVEQERQVVDILELDVGLGQGHLFGEPRAIREQVLAETTPPADYIRSTLTPRRFARAS